MGKQIERFCIPTIWQVDIRWSLPRLEVEVFRQEGLRDVYLVHAWPILFVCGEKMNTLHHIHHSAVGKKMKARGMSYTRVTQDQREAVENLTLEIFTDMVNAGNSLQSTLSAIYFSGVTHALEFSTDGGEVK